MHGSNIYEPKSKKCELNFSNRFLKKNSKDEKKKKREYAMKKEEF